MPVVYDEMILKINGNGTRYEVIHVTPLFFHFAERTCQTKRSFKQTYVHFLGSNLFASCPGTRVHNSNWLENCQLYRCTHARRSSCDQSGSRGSELQIADRSNLKPDCIRCWFLEQSCEFLAFHNKSKTEVEELEAPMPLIKCVELKSEPIQSQ